MMKWRKFLLINRKLPGNSMNGIRYWVKICTNIMYDYVPQDINTTAANDKFSDIAEHALAVAGYARNMLENKRQQLRVADVFDAVGWCYCLTGKFSLSINCYKEYALQIYIKYLGSESPVVAALYNNIGETYNDWGKFDEAYDYYYKALKIRKKTQGINNPFTAQSYSNIGTIWCTRCQYKLAYQHYKKALKIRKRHFPEISIETGSSFNVIGDLYWKEGLPQKALKYFKKDLDIIEYFYAEHPDVIGAKINIGNVYSELGKYEDALNIYFEALNLCVKLKLENTPIFGTIHNNIGFAYEYIMYKNAEYTPSALTYYEKALEIRLALLGEMNPETAQTYCNIGNILFLAGEDSKAYDFYQKSLKIRKKIFGKFNSETMISYSCIGSISYYRIEYKKAISNYATAIKISNQLGLKNQNVAQIYQNFGDAYLVVDKRQQALTTYLSAYKILCGVLPSASMVLHNLYELLKNIYYEFTGKNDFDNWLILTT